MSRQRRGQPDVWDITGARRRKNFKGVVYYDTRLRRCGKMRPVTCGREPSRGGCRENVRWGSGAATAGNSFKIFTKNQVGR